MMYSSKDEPNVVVKTTNKGLGLGTILTIIFLVLQLCGVISWPWVCVFLPIIISAGFWVLLIILFIIATIMLNKH